MLICLVRRLAIRDNELKLLLDPPPTDPEDHTVGQRLELYSLPPFGDKALLSHPPEYQNLANDPRYAKDVQRLSALAIAWYETLPVGPHQTARGCMGYRFPGAAESSDQGSGDYKGHQEDDQTTWWG